MCWFWSAAKSLESGANEFSLCISHSHCQLWAADDPWSNWQTPNKGTALSCQCASPLPSVTSPRLSQSLAVPELSKTFLYKMVSQCLRCSVSMKHNLVFSQENSAAWGTGLRWWKSDRLGWKPNFTAGLLDDDEAWSLQRLDVEWWNSTCSHGYSKRYMRPCL